MCDRCANEANWSNASLECVIFRCLVALTLRSLEPCSAKRTVPTFSIRAGFEIVVTEADSPTTLLSIDGVELTPC